MTLVPNFPPRAPRAASLRRLGGRLTAAIALAACAPGGENPSAGSPAHYLFAWAYDVDERKEDTNFLVVIDADPRSPTYTRVVATLPTRTVGGMPHHTEQMLPPNGWPLFANAFMANRSFLLDLNEPLQPRVVRELGHAPGYHMPHSFYRLADGRVVATLQFGPDSVAGKPGGLGLFSAEGELLRVSSSRDSTFAGAAIRTYSGDVSEGADRVITVSSPMDTERTADVMQLWRLSDLVLLKTIAVPPVTTDTMWRYPFEVRFVKGGREAFMTTYYCAFYHLTGLDGEQPAITRVHELDFPRQTACGVPTMVGHWYILPVTASREILVFDLSDPAKPRQVHALATDSTFEPHWSSRDPGSDRIVFPTEAHNDARILIARFDSTTGRLAWDESFRDPATKQLGVSLKRDLWPHGATGPAAPHGVVFGSGSPKM